MKVQFKEVALIVTPDEARLLLNLLVTSIDSALDGRYCIQLGDKTLEQYLEWICDPERGEGRKIVMIKVLDGLFPEMEAMKELDAILHVSYHQAVEWNAKQKAKEKS